MATLETKSWIGRTNSVLHLYRCKDCGALLTRKTIEQGACNGHYIYDHVLLSLWERIKIMLGLVK